MITSNISGLHQFCTRDVFGTRISAFFTAYRGLSGAQFFVQNCGSGICAAISKLDSAVTISCTPNADFDELLEYLRFVGTDSLLCSKEVRENLSFPFQKCGSVVEYRAVHSKPPDAAIIESSSESFSYSEIFRLLEKCGFLLGNYDSWLADLCLRTRRGTAKSVCIAKHGNILSTASALFITDTAVLLGAVGTSPDARGMGFAGALVGSLAAEFSQKRVELLCEQHRLSFYENIGFIKTGEWTQ